MKKLLLIFLLFFAAKSFAQYPAIQGLGNDSTLIRVGQNYKGGIKGGLINMSVADTTAANLLRIKAYPGAQIYTTSDGQVWVRNLTATGWVLMGGGSSPSGSFWRVGGNEFPITIATRDIGTGSFYGGAVGLMTNGIVRAIVPNTGFSLSNDTTSTKIFTINPSTKEWGYANWNNGGGGSGWIGKYQDWLFTGQSNMVGASGATSLDTAANSRVLVWLNNRWGVAHLGQYPFRNDGSGNHGFYFAKKLAEENQNDTIRMVMAAYDGLNVYNWFNYATNLPGPIMDSIEVKSLAAGISAYSGMVWDQGESDLVRENGLYKVCFDSIKTILRSNSWFPQTTPIIVVGMPQPSNGADPVWGGMDSLFKWMDRGDDLWVGYARVDGEGMGMAPGSTVHFDSTALHKIGEERVYQAWQSLPHRFAELYNGYYADTLNYANFTDISGTITASGVVYTMGSGSYMTDTLHPITGDGVYEVETNGTGVYVVGLDENRTNTYYSSGGLYNYNYLWYTVSGSLYAGDGGVSTASPVSIGPKVNFDAIRFTRQGDSVNLYARMKDFYVYLYTFTHNSTDTLWAKISAFNPSVVYSAKMTGICPCGGSSGSATLPTLPAGNYGNIQLNRNGAFATPASDSLDWESATGLFSGRGMKTNGGIQAQGSITSATGSGLEFENNGGTTYITSYNRTGSAWLPNITRASSFEIQTSGSVAMFITGQKVNIGDNTSPTAFLQLRAGTSSASTAPLKFVSGTNMSTPESGALEFDGTNFYATNSTAARRTVVLAGVGTATAAANDLTLPKNGNVFHITGTTQINAITTSGWPAGIEITLIFDSTPTVKNNTAGGGGTATFLLLGGADFAATANDVLKVVYDGTNFIEVSRSVN